MFLALKQIPSNTGSGGGGVETSQGEQGEMDSREEMKKINNKRGGIENKIKKRCKEWK